MKRLSKFSPSARLPLAEADHHYEHVHHRFAMRMFRQHAPQVRRYATNHAVARRDLNAGFEQRPSSWRYVLLEFDEPDQATGGGGGWLPAWAEGAIVRDHTNFLREVRPFEVVAETLVDRRGSQTSVVKYMVEVESPRGAAAADEAYKALCEAIAAASRDAFGLRLVVANSVLRESEMTAVEEPGQAYTGRSLADTTMRGIVEVYLDHRDWGQEFFALPELQDALRQRPDVTVAVHAVDELVGVDRS